MIVLQVRADKIMDFYIDTAGLTPEGPGLLTERVLPALVLGPLSTIALFGIVAALVVLKFSRPMFEELRRFVLLSK